jgi:hypothetical protein
VRGNKDGFDQLATDSRELVYVIFRANQNVEKEEDLPAGLREGLDQVLKWVEFKLTFMLVFVTPNLAFFMESK